ncbi:hypothetical protein ZTR_09543 [Talaromyces verruculosus]|nr:hypothetical protein ZTR_09543 [Talaromyces verruculosus]
MDHTADNGAYIEVADPQQENPYEVRWDDRDSDSMNPRSMDTWRKWVTVLIVSASSLCVSNSGTIDLRRGTWNWAHVTGTFVLAVSEFYGRRPVYIFSFGFFVIWLIPSAVSENIQTILVARFLDGIAGSAFLSVAGGTVGDLFSKKHLQLPMMVYTASPFIGPSIGPLLGGFINQYTSWRWTFYMLLIWSGVNFALILFFVPETYHPVLLRHKAQKLRDETGDKRWEAPIEKINLSILKIIMYSFLRPLQLLFLEPMCFLLCLFSAILLGILYLFFGAFPLVFGVNHGFTLSETGMTFLGILTGMLLGISTEPLWRRNYERLVNRREDATGETEGSHPEYRLPPAIAGGCVVPVGLFLFGWTTYGSIHWVAPIIGAAIFGIGTVLVFSGIFTFLVDAYPLYAASALAANSFLRNIFAGEWNHLSFARKA